MNRVVPFTRTRLPVHQRARITAIRDSMRRWGMTPAQVGMGLGVSRQYIWVILQERTYVSDAKLEEIERLVAEWITRQRDTGTAGQRLRAARLYAGLTLKEVADLIGYSWVSVERWEKNACLPKPGVLWQLRHLYGMGEDWISTGLPHGASVQQPPSLSVGA